YNLRKSGYTHCFSYCTKDFRQLMTNLLISCGIWNEIDMNHIRDVIKNHCSIPSQPSKTYINYMKLVTNLDIDRSEIYYYYLETFFNERSKEYLEHFR